MGISLDQLPVDADDHYLESIAQEASLLNVAITEVEFLRAWATDDRAAATEELERCVRLIRAFNPDRVHVGSVQRPPNPNYLEGLREICRRVAPTTVALEFMPFGGIPDIDSAGQVFVHLKCNNLKILIDLWHWIKSEPTSWNVPPPIRDHIAGVQLADVRRGTGGTRTDSLTTRKNPGEGTGQVVSILRSLRAQRITPCIDVEVMSTELDQVDATSVACQSYRSAVTALRKAQWV